MLVGGYCAVVMVILVVLVLVNVFIGGDGIRLLELSMVVVVGICDGVLVGGGGAVVMVTWCVCFHVVLVVVLLI